MIVYPCGCSVLDGRPYKRCADHQADLDAGKLKPHPELDDWAKRQGQRT
jgi:hypothetical protein